MQYGVSIFAHLYWETQRLATKTTNMTPFCTSILVLIGCNENGVINLDACMLTDKMNHKIKCNVVR